MKPAYYMRFVEGDTSTRDRVGGLPTQRPMQVPVCPICGSEMAFLAQFYANEHLNFGGAPGVHLYQCLNVDEGCDPQPVLAVLTSGAVENVSGAGVLAPDVQQYGIEWDYAEDPDEIPLQPGFGGKDQALYSSKAGGALPFLNALPPDTDCILQLTQRPANLNFGGLRAAICKSGEDLITVLV